MSHAAQPQTAAELLTALRAAADAAPNLPAGTAHGVQVMAVKARGTARRLIDKLERAAYTLDPQALASALTANSLCFQSGALASANPVDGLAFRKALIAMLRAYIGRRYEQQRAAARLVARHLQARTVDAEAVAATLAAVQGLDGPKATTDEAAALVKRWQAAGRRVNKALDAGDFAAMRAAGAELAAMEREAQRLGVTLNG